MFCSHVSAVNNRTFVFFHRMSCVSATLQSERYTLSYQSGREGSTTVQSQKVVTANFSIFLITFQVSSYCILALQSIDACNPT